MTGFAATWTVCAYALTVRAGALPWKYNAWTAGVMGSVALIQLLEFFAWMHWKSVHARRRIARLLEPTVFVQPFANCVLGGWATGQTWLMWMGVPYAALLVSAFVGAPRDNDFRRGTEGHLSWPPVMRGAKGWAYMAGVFLPLAVALVAGNARYGASMMAALAATLMFSRVRYSVNEANSMWCFWGLALAVVGVSLNFLR
jgi:hypothetical protein